MIKRLLWVAVLLMLLGVPVMAQDASVAAEDLVPANFAGFIHLRLDDPNQTLFSMRVFAFVGSKLQPLRIAFANDLVYDDFMPFTTIFDAEGTSFESHVLPWLNGEMVIAYSTLDGSIQTELDNDLIILPTNNLLQSAALMSDVINGQDLPKQEIYRDIPIYIGDKTAIALTSQAVFVGGLEPIKAALDVQAGAAPHMTESLTYREVRAASPENPVVFGYVTGDYLLPALNGLLNGVDASQALLSAFGGALSQIRPDASLETLLLNGGVDGAGAALELADDEATIHASAIFHTPSALIPMELPAINDALLTMLPRNAWLVQSGADFSGFLYNTMTAMPMTNFARQIFGGVLIQTIGTESELIAAPNAEQVQSAVTNFMSAVNRFGSFDLEQDLLDHLHGQYSIALYPRVNNPVPFLNTPFDLLVVTQASAGKSFAAQQGISRLLQTFYGLQEQDLGDIQGWQAIGLGLTATSQPIFTIAVQDDKLIFGTGGTIAEALAAARGDNRLIAQTAWQELSALQSPDLYVDVNVVYNTFFAPRGGVQLSSDSSRIRLVANATTPSDQIFRFDMTVTTGL